MTVLAIFSAVAVAGIGDARAAEDQPDLPTPTTPVLSARRFPGALQGPTADADLASAIDQYLSKVVGTSCAVVEQDGRIIYSKNADDSLAPASTLKLATALAAMDILGPDARFTTRFVADKNPKNGVIDGDLYVVGGGDPLFATAGYKTVFDDPDQFYEDLFALATTLSDAGIKEITGGIVGDESRYDTVRWVPSWPTRYQVGGTVAPLSALVVNDGSTGYSDTPNDATTNRKAGDSALLFAQTLRTVLTSRGIKVGGTASTGRAPAEGREVASFDSVPMVEVLSEMLTNSDNTTAELVTKEIGLAATGQGTTTAGVEAIKDSLRAQGFDLQGLVMLDGSGLDTGDRLSCSLAIALLKAAVADQDLADSLPVGGRTGTLRKRMLASASTGRVRAKTGTLNSVNALTGFAETPPGNRLTFALIHNGNDIRTTGVADGFTDRLMTYAKGPRLNLLEPLPIR